MTGCTMLDGKPRRSRECKECHTTFQILNKKSTKTICPECYKKIVEDLPRTIKERDDIYNLARPLDDIRRMNSWDQKKKYSEKDMQKIHHQHSEYCSQAHALWNKICNYRELLKAYHDAPKLLAYQDQCDHIFDDLELTGALGENPMDSCRIEYWAKVVCLRCEKELNLHNRVA